jgi:hypothetical protein
MEMIYMSQLMAANSEIASLREANAALYEALKDIILLANEAGGEWFGEKEWNRIEAARAALAKAVTIK